MYFMMYITKLGKRLITIFLRPTWNIVNILRIMTITIIIIIIIIMH